MDRSTRTRNALPVGVAIACAIVSVFFLLTASSQADYEAAVFAVRYFDGVCEGGADNDHNTIVGQIFHDTAASASYWNYDAHYYWTNTAVDGYDFTDNTRYPTWGNDLAYEYGTDWADTIFLGTHGYTQCMELSTSYSNGNWRCCGHDGYNCTGGSTYDCTVQNSTRFKMGDDTGVCNLRTNDYSGGVGHIYLGNTIDQVVGDANIFVTNACNSITPCVRHLGGYEDMDSGDFNTYLGFYGKHDLYSSDRSKGGESAWESYLQTTENDNIGSEWLTYHHYPNYDEGGYDCPMVLIWGSNGTNCNNMYNNGGFTDFKDTGTHTINTMYWVGGCDPDAVGYDLEDLNHPALPDL